MKSYVQDVNGICIVMEKQRELFNTASLSTCELGFEKVSHLETMGHGNKSIMKISVFPFSLFEIMFIRFKKSRICISCSQQILFKGDYRHDQQGMESEY